MKFSGYRELINDWSSVVEFAHEMQVPYQRAYRWYYRDQIPLSYWTRLLVLLRARGVAVDMYDLLELSERE